MTYHRCPIDSSMNTPIDNECPKALCEPGTGTCASGTHARRERGGLPDKYAIHIINALVIDPLL